MGTLSDFKVAEGLIVGGSDIHLNGSVNATISVDTVVGTDADGKSLTISAGAGNGTGVGGILDFKTAPGGTSGSGAGTPASRMSIAADGTVTIGNLDVSAGTLTLANDQISGDKISGGTIGTITITALAGDLSLGDNSITNVGDINADSLSVDAAGNGLKLDFSGANTAKSIILMGDNLASALDITEGSNSYVKFTTTNSSEQIVFGKNSTFSGTTIANLGTVSAATSITSSAFSGPLDGVVGGNTPAAGSFTTISASSTGLISGTGRVGGSAIETNTRLQVNGPALSGSDAATAYNYVEARLHTDIGNDDVAGTTYNGMGNALLLDQAENIHVGQGVVFTQGRSSSGNSFAIGRVGNRGGSASSNHLTVGYYASPFDSVVNSANNPLEEANALLKLESAGNLTLKKAGAALGFTSNGQTTSLKGHDSASGSVTYQLPAAAPGSSGYILSSTTGGVMSWVAQSSGTITALNNATENELVTVGSTTTELDAEANLSFTGNTLTINDGANNASSSSLKFVKNRNNDGSAGQDGDDIGAISFHSYNDAGTPEDIEYARIDAEISDASDGAEGGKLSLQVASHDGEMQSGIVLTDGDAEDEIDITIGSGANSVTTIAGDLVVNGGTTTISTTQITVEDDLITISKGNDTLTNADGSGMEIECTDGSTDNIHWKYVHGRTALQSNVDIDLATTSESYKIAGTDVLTNNQVLGKTLPGTVVGTTEAQTLSNKTLVEPYISNGTAGQTWAARMDTRETTITNSGSVTTIFTYDGDAVRTAKLLIQVTNDETETEAHAVEMLVTYQGADGPEGDADAKVFAVEYASVFTGAAALGTFDVADSAGSGDNVVDVNFTPATTDTYKIKVFATLLEEY